MQIIRCHLVIITAIAASLSACTTLGKNPDTADSGATMVDVAPSRAPADIQKIAELERQLIREQRQCLVEKRRLDLSLKESQKLNDELQKKLEALLAIDRDLRNRGRNR